MTLSLLGFLMLLVIAAIAGAIGKSLGGYHRGGIIVAAAVGFIGALIGMWLSRTLALPDILVIQIEGQPFPFIWSVIGGTLLSLLIGFISRSRLG